VRHARVFAYGPDSLEEANLDHALAAGATPESLAAALEPWIRDARATWIDIETDDRALVAAALGRLVPLHPIVSDVLVQRDHRPAIDRYPGLVHVILDLAHAERTLSFEKVDTLLGDRWLVTVGGRPDGIFDPIRMRLRRGDALRALGMPFLLHALVEAMCQADVRLLDRLGTRMEKLELGLITRPGPGGLQRIHAVKRDLRGLRRSVVPLMESATTFLQNRRLGEPPLHDDLDMAVREIHDELASVGDILDAYRDAAQNLAELYASSVSNRLNEIMRTLAIISTVFIPLNFVAGVFGMNFERMPGTDSPAGFWVAMGLMAALAAAVVAISWRQGWLRSPTARTRTPGITRNSHFDEPEA